MKKRTLSFKHTKMICVLVLIISLILTGCREKVDNTSDVLSQIIESDQSTLSGMIQPNAEETSKNSPPKSKDIVCESTGCVAINGDFVFYNCFKTNFIYVWNGNETVRYGVSNPPSGMAAYDGYLYFYSGETIYRMNFSGGEKTQLYTLKDEEYFITDFATIYNNRLAILNDKLYFFTGSSGNGENTDNNDGTLECHTMNLDGTQESTLFSFEFAGGVICPGETEMRKWRMNKEGIWILCDISETKTENQKYFINYYSFGDGKLTTSWSGSHNDYCADSPQTLNTNIGSVHYLRYDCVEKGDWVYFSYDKCIYRKNKSGTVQLVLSIPNYYKGFSLNDSLVAAVSWDMYGEGIYQISVCNPDGSNQRIIDGMNNRASISNEGGSGSNYYAGGNTYEPSVQQTPKTCSVCHGLGYTTCNICSGSGYVWKYTINGSELYHCSHCSNGRNDCIVCGGDGRVQD